MSSVEADGLDALRQAWFSGMTPDMSLEVSEWADQHRILSSRGASEAGPYRTARTPYMRGIMDAGGDTTGLVEKARAKSRPLFMGQERRGAAVDPVGDGGTAALTAPVRTSSATRPGAGAMR